MKREKPFISLVLVAGPQRQRSQRALQSLLDQEAGSELEILLIDTGNAAAPLPGADDPRVRSIAARKEQTYVAMRIAAINEAQGDVVAFLEEHAAVLPGWFNALKQAFRSGNWAGVGCEMHNANPGRGISNAVALMNYMTWTPPALPGSSRMLPGHNSAYRRDVLLSWHEELPMLLQSEVLLQWRICESGRQLRVEPSARIAHLNEGRIATICHGYYLWNRCFGSSRARIYQWPLAKKLGRVLGTPLMPFVRLGKAAIFLLRRSPRRFAKIFLYWPVWLIAWSAAAAGQAMGIVFGPGDAENRFGDYELSTPRPEPLRRPVP